MKDFTWQHISFANGSCPYICKTQKEFKRIQERYLLIPICENFWKATDSISYSVVGFADKNKIANFYREYKTKQSAMRVAQKLRDAKYERVVLRKEIRNLRNDDEHFEISITTPLCVYE